MNLFDRSSFVAFVGGLTATEIVYQWGDAAVAKVGGKIFALQTENGAAGRPALSFKASEMSFEMLPTLTGLSPAPYLARSKWVQATQGCALSDAELDAYLRQAHALVVAKLPKRTRALLGVADPEGNQRA